MDKWAILIGIDQYRHFEHLNYAENDVHELKKAFRELLEFPEHNVIEMSDNSDRKPSRDAIFRQLAEISRKNIQPDDLLFFYFGGHAMFFNKGSESYLLPPDASPENLGLTAIKVEDVVYYLKKTGCKNIVMFIDAGRDASTSGEISTEVPISKSSPQAADLKGIIMFFSCGPEETSFEIKELKHSSFAYGLLEAIKDPDCRTVEEMDKYLRLNVPATNLKYKKNNQTPYVIVEPVESLKAAYFAGRVQSSEMKKKTDDLFNKLGERFVKGQMDADLLNRSTDIVSSAQDGFRDEQHKKIYELIEMYSKGEINNTILKSTLMAVQQRMDGKSNL
jgi:uncharacterized caspase-like protein